MLTFMWIGGLAILVIALIFVKMSAGNDRRKNQSGSGFEKAPTDVQQDKMRAGGRGDD